MIWPVRIGGIIDFSITSPCHLPQAHLAVLHLHPGHKSRNYKVNDASYRASASLTLFTDGGGQSQCASRHPHRPHGGGRAGLEAGWDPLSRVCTTIRSTTCCTWGLCLGYGPRCTISILPTKTSHIRTVSVAFLTFWAVLISLLKYMVTRFAVVAMNLG